MDAPRHVWCNENRARLNRALHEIASLYDGRTLDTLNRTAADTVAVLIDHAFMCERSGVVLHVPALQGSTS